MTILARISQMQHNYPRIAYLYAILGNIVLIGMQMFLKISCRYISSTHSLGIRGFFLLILNSVVVYFLHLDPYVKNPIIFRLLMKRMVFSTLTVWLFLSPLSQAPASTLNSLFNTAPLIVSVLQIYFYKKSIDRINIFLTLISFVGVIFVIKPQFLFGNNDSSSIRIYMGMALLAAVTNSFSMIYLHQLGGHVNNVIALQYFYISQCIFNNLFTMFTPLEIKTDSIDSLFYISIVGLVLCAFFVQNMITKATFLKKPSYIMPFGYITIIGTFFTDKFIFGSTFDTLSIIGIFMTSIGLLSKLLIVEKPPVKQ